MCFINLDEIRLVMKSYYLNYSKNFKCVGGKCKHNCCLLWQIDIDAKSIKKYQEFSNTDLNFAQNVNFDNKTFNMTFDRRCKFLNEDNLCDLIIKYGENNLCYTCKTHPRFKNFFGGVCEIGVGMACEEGTRLLLGNDRNVKFALTKDQKYDKSKFSPFEKKLFAFRNKTLKIVQDKKTDLAQKFFCLFRESKVDTLNTPVDFWLNILKKQERLDENSLLYHFSSEKTLKEIINEKLDRAFEEKFVKILSYFIYRHLAKSLDQIDVYLYLSYCLLNTLLIKATFLESGGRMEDLLEICRQYSAEVEYNDQNENAILDSLENYLRLL